MAGCEKAKNLVHDKIPSELTLVGLAVAPNDVANSFANHFQSKVKTLIHGSKLNANVYNGKNTLIVANRS